MSSPRPEQPGDGAEIIPIGTRGRPGRGTGQRPSAAARGLVAPSRRTTKPTPVKPPIDLEAEAPVEELPGQDLPVAEDVVSLHAETDAPSAGTSGGPSVRVSGPTHPITHIPVGEWVSAINHAARETFGEEWEPQLARFLAFLRRRVTGDFSIDPYGFDEEITTGFLLAALRPIAQKWFRIEVVGAENIPATGGALVVSNHSGTLPMDALMTLVQVHDHSDRFLRLLGADLVFRLPFVSSIARKAGATLACSEDAERMLRDGHLVGVWPEGFKGIGKPFSERYKLQRFGRGGFVASAIRTGVPIIPVSVVGAEEIYPLVGNVPALARALGLPYLPITPFFPLLGPLGAIPLPSKWLIEFGEPIRTDAYEAGAADDPMLVFNVTDQVRETIQQTLFGLLQQRQSVFR